MEACRGRGTRREHNESELTATPNIADVSRLLAKSEEVGRRVGIGEEGECEEESLGWHGRKCGKLERTRRMKDKDVEMPGRRWRWRRRVFEEVEK